MKLKRLCAAALITAIGAASFAPVANASQTEHNSTGRVKVSGGTIDPVTPNVPDPEDTTKPPIPPAPVTPGVIVNPDIDDKGIVAVSDLEFGTLSVGDNTANAAPLTLTDGSTRGNIVSFADVTGSYSGYNISAELTSQFSNGTTTLAGATITYTNPLLATSGVGAITAAPTATGVLALGTPVTFVRAAATEGSGLWSLEFGQSKDYTGSAATATDANSVVLDIPQSVADTMTTGDYTATVKWTMGAYAP